MCRLEDRRCGLWVRRWLLISLVSNSICDIGLFKSLLRECIAGGCAGAASRTVVSPLERLKIIQSDTTILILGISWNETFFIFYFYRQVQPRGSESQYKGVWRSLLRMWQEEGFKGFMRGNGINCLRIVPYRWGCGGALSSLIALSYCPSLTPSSLLELVADTLPLILVLCSSQRTNNWKRYK